MLDRNGQNGVAKIMPEIQDPMGAITQKTRTENDIRIVIDQGDEESLQFTRIIFQVGVLDGNKITGSPRKGRTQRSSLALVDGMPQNDNFRVLRCEGLGDREAFVLGPVIHHDDLEMCLFIPDVEDPLNALFERVAFVITGDPLC